VLLAIPEHSLVLLIGAAGSGKSTFARKHFKNTEIVSSDALRAVVSDDEADQSASHDAFHLLRSIVVKRLQRGKLTVVDATNVQRKSRRALLALAARNASPASAIVFNLPLEVCLARNQDRQDRRVPAKVVEKQVADLLDSIPGLAAEGLQNVYVLDNQQDIDSLSVLRA
jgi:protein phosphatase